MKVLLGHDDYLLTKGQNQIVACDYNRLVNAHILVMGKTGMGKTTTLHNIISQLRGFGGDIRVHVFDVHGDINLPGASSFRFSEATEFGLNPFVVSSDPHFGGVRKRVQDFIATIGGTQAIGARQEAVMRHLVTDLFAANGFFADNPKSWVLDDGFQRKYPKRYPTMDDMCRFAFGKLKQLIIGSDSQSGRALEELNKTTSKLYRLSKKLVASDMQSSELLMEQSVKHRADALRLYQNYIENIETGKELDDFIRYESREVLKSVVDRFENLRASGVFKNQAPPFDQNNPIWRYDITALREDEKRLFVEFRLQELFGLAQEKGALIQGEAVLRHVFIIDEAHLFLREDSHNIINRIAKEGRKFGLGLVCASQSPTHFSEDFFANVGTKIVLGVDTMYWDNLVRKMKIDAGTLKYIRPFSVMGVQMNNKGEPKSPFIMVRLADCRERGGVGGNV
ncbi:ATP-binding protein [Methylovulum psychrotolerans]|uniref:AAA+ ATPase domain-containing protein n=1 Tax=Methylovulum psychrotolerans TaxID=1704499 RepID=A0A2S5CIP0_9GAMM|nr:ATP-binding protein [Methylovulum psychrotolerans]POZ50666.1 hypothetical protein AADEFJLK_03563 [Methylovulum psychrotolerans]